MQTWHSKRVGWALALETPATALPLWPAPHRQLCSCHGAQSTPGSAPQCFIAIRSQTKGGLLWIMNFTAKRGAETSKCLDPYFSLYLSIYSMRSTCKRILRLFNYLKANKHNDSCSCNFNLSDLGRGMTHFNTTTLSSPPSLREH